MAEQDVPQVEVAPATDQPARDEHGRFVGQQADETAPAEGEQEVVKVPRKLKVANDEYELPDELPDEIYQRVAKTATDLTGAWTRSMQEAANARKQAQDELQQRAIEWQASQANLDLIAEQKALQKSIKDYEGVNWQQLADQDPVLAQKHWMNYQTIQTQATAKGAEIEGKKQEAMGKQREAFQRAAYEMNRALQDPSNGIPNWGEATHRQLVEYGLTYGFRPEEISSTLDPRAFRVMHKAYLYDESLKKAKAASGTEQKPAPVSKVGGTAAAGRVDPDKMSTEDWLKWRNKEKKVR